jgi:outer membrane protein OmpA-like peptidoglycan-associated protein
MSKLFFVFFLFLALPGQWAWGQVQWATEVIGFSSEFVDPSASPQFRAIQALHKPNKLPQAGSCPCAWSPAKPDGPEEEWIKVGFQRPIYARQIGIGENFNPGAISKVWVYDINGQETLVFQNQNPGPLPDKGRMFQIAFTPRPQPIKAVKVALMTRAVPGWNHIDAIGISDEPKPIQAVINTLPNQSITQIEKLGAEINTRYDEILPVISPDGQFLYFDRKNHPENTKGTAVNDDIWFSVKQGDKWSEAKRMPAPLNNEDHNFVCSVTPDGNTLLLGNIYKRTGKGEGGISISHRTEEGWSFPEPLIIEGYKNKNAYSEYFLANNRQILLLAIESDKTFGGRDLYVSFLQESGRWSAPKNLGATINSAATELTPFLASDNKTLYFSSSGFSGYGETDMFVSRRLDDSWTNWSEPLNLGPILNSSDWDASYTIDARGEYAYFVSYKNSTAGSADIFRARLPKEIQPDPIVMLKGQVFDSKTQKPIQASITYQRVDNPQEKGLASSSPGNGAFSIVLPQGTSYILAAGAKNYFTTSTKIDFTDLKGYQEIRENLYLTPLEVNTVMRFEQVNFAQGTEALLPESFGELNRWLDALRNNTKLTIQIEGHTDMNGNPFDNMKLSENRVLEVKKFLTDRGIPSERIKTRAFGSTMPLTKNRDEESQKLNRRVEIRVIEF